MKTKTFDCVEMKRKGALRIYEELKDKSFEEKVEYWRQANEEFHRRVESGKGNHRRNEKLLSSGGL